MQDERVETAAVSTGGRRVQPKEPRRHDEGGGKRPGAGRILLRIGAVLLTFVAALALTLLISLKMVCSSAFPSAQQMFVTTILATGQLKFLASWFLSSEEIQEIVDKNSMKALNASVDTALIQVGGSGSVNVGGESGEEDSGDPIEIVEVAGANYTGTMMIVKDPARVSLATIYPWREVGVPLDQLVASAGAIGGINR